jgi:hypothetical protein
MTNLYTRTSRQVQQSQHSIGSGLDGSQPQSPSSTQNAPSPQNPRIVYGQEIMQNGGQQVSIGINPQNPTTRQRITNEHQGNMGGVPQLSVISPQTPQQLEQMPNSGGNQALQDYQMQLMLLEMQNKKMRMLSQLSQGQGFVNVLSGNMPNAMRPPSSHPTGFNSQVNQQQMNMAWSHLQQSGVGGPGDWQLRPVGAPMTRLVSQGLVPEGMGTPQLTMPLPLTPIKKAQANSQSLTKKDTKVRFSTIRCIYRRNIDL